MNDHHNVHERRALISLAVFSGLGVAMAGAAIFEILKAGAGPFEYALAGMSAFVGAAIVYCASQRVAALPGVEKEIDAGDAYVAEVLATFEATLDNMPQGVALYDKQRRIVLANRRYAEMYGLHVEDIKPGMPMQEILRKRVEKGVFLGTDSSLDMDARIKAMASPDSTHAIERYADGRVIEKSRKPMPGGGWLSVHADITERQQANDKVNEVLATFDATLNNMPQGVALYSKEQTIILANRRYAEMYGLSPGEITPGMSMNEILRKRVERGVFLGADPSLDVEGRVNAMAKPTTAHDIEHYADGRVIEKSRKPMPLGGWLSVHEDITLRQRAEDRIAWMAHHDALTSLANRVVLKDKLDDAFARLRRSGSEFALLQLDLDDFKLVNDTMGHPVGDKLLSEVADRLRQSVRDVDLVVRIGGDEFAILQGSDPDMRTSADALAHRLMEAVCAPYHIDGFPLSIQMSIGVALAPNDGENGAILQQNADLALYQAKEGGRRAIRFFDPQMDTALRVERMLETDLRQAVQLGQLEVHYQAVLDVQSRRTVGMEALARWRHPRLGMVPPDRFIRIAERTGQINSIGAWVLETACTEAVRWPKDIRIAVNLSPSQFKSGDLFATVRAALEKSGLPPERLTLEITESTLLEKTDGNLAVLSDLRAFGMAIALDDFGTGFSSLSYLKTICFDVLKIDRSFIIEMETNPRSSHIIAGIVALSRSLDYTTVAEGIETWEQFELIRAAGCTCVQGFLFSRPKPARELVFEDWPSLEATRAA